MAIIIDNEMLKSTEQKRKDLLCCLCLDVDIVGTTHFEIYKFISLLHHPPPPPKFWKSTVILVNFSKVYSPPFNLFSRLHLAIEIKTNKKLHSSKTFASKRKKIHSNMCSKNELFCFFLRVPKEFLRTLCNVVYLCLTSRRKRT